MTNRREDDGYIQLRDAIRRKDRETAKKLILDNVNVNNPQSKYNTPLHWAITQFEDLEITTMLLDRGANLDAKNQHNLKPLDVAIRNNKTQAALLLISKGALIHANLNALLLKLIELNDHKIFKYVINSKYNRNARFEALFTAAIYRGHAKILGYILPHRQFSKLSDKYIPKDLVIKPGSQYKDCIELLLKWNFIVNPVSNQDEDFIFGAVENGHLPIVLRLLELGIDVNLTESNTGLSLLKIACLKKHYAIVEILLKHQASLNTTTPTNYEILNAPSIHYCNSSFLTNCNRKNLSSLTCLHIAVLNSDPIMTRLLLRYGAKIIDDPTFFIITCMAVQINCEEIVRIFLDQGVNITELDSQGKSLLHFCVYSDVSRLNCRYNIARILLERGAGIHLQVPGNSLIFEAVKNGLHKIAQLFLNYNANIQYINPDGDTLLHKAIEKNFHVEFIKTLLNRNLSVNDVNNNMLTPLHFACKYKNDMTACIIKLLLENNANIEAVDDKGWTPLFEACHSNNDVAVQCLLDKNANANHIDVENLTPLYIAAQHCYHHSETVETLLKNHVNVHCMDKQGNSIIHVVVQKKNVELIKSLARTQVNFNPINKQGNTPLHIAVKSECADVIENLIKYGANINILNKKNQTPLQIAVKRISILQNRLKNTRDSRDSYWEHRCFWNDVNEDDYDTDSYLSDSNRIKKVINILKVHVVKLKVAGLKVNKQNLKIVYNSENYRNDKLINPDQNDTDNTLDGLQLEGSCEQEIERMIVENIGVNNITIYDLLKTNIHILSRYVKNKIIKQTLELKVFTDKFPLYIDIVRSRFRDAKLRYRLMKSAKRYLISNINKRLSDACIDNIFSYLNIKEIKMFIRAMKPLNK